MGCARRPACGGMMRLGPALLVALQLVRGAGCGLAPHAPAPVPRGWLRRAAPGDPASAGLRYDGGLAALRGGGMRGLYDPGPEDPKRRPFREGVRMGRDEEPDSAELLRELTAGVEDDDGDEVGSQEAEAEAEDMRLREKLPGYDSQVRPGLRPPAPALAAELHAAAARPERVVQLTREPPCTQPGLPCPQTSSISDSMSEPINPIDGDEYEDPRDAVWRRFREEVSQHQLCPCGGVCATRICMTLCNYARVSVCVRMRVHSRGLVLENVCACTCAHAHARRRTLSIALAHKHCSSITLRRLTYPHMHACMVCMRAEVDTVLSDADMHAYTRTYTRTCVRT